LAPEKYMVSYRGKKAQYNHNFELTPHPVKFHASGFGSVYLRPKDSNEDYICGVAYASFQGNSKNF
jgi:hypothetical protein